MEKQKSPKDQNQSMFLSLPFFFLSVCFFSFLPFFSLSTPCLFSLSHFLLFFLKVSLSICFVTVTVVTGGLCFIAIFKFGLLLVSGARRCHRLFCREFSQDVHSGSVYMLVILNDTKLSNGGFNPHV